MPRWRNRHIIQSNIYLSYILSSKRGCPFLPSVFRETFISVSSVAITQKVHFLILERSLQLWKQKLWVSCCQVGSPAYLPCPQPCIHTIHLVQVLTQLLTPARWGLLRLINRFSSQYYYMKTFARTRDRTEMYAREGQGRRDKAAPSINSMYFSHPRVTDTSHSKILPDALHNHNIKFLSP